MGDTEIVLKCRWCNADLAPDLDGVYGVVGVDGSLCCDDRIPGCSACDDGEPHPHEAVSTHDQ